MDTESEFPPLSPKSDTENKPDWFKAATEEWSSMLTDCSSGKLTKTKANEFFKAALEAALNAAQEQDPIMSELSEIKELLRNHQHKPSFAEITAHTCAIPNHGLNAHRPPPPKPELTIVLGTGKRGTMAEFKSSKEKIGQIIAPIKNNIRIEHIRESRTGNVVITFATNDDKQKAKQILNKESMKIKDPEDRKVPLIVHGVSKQDEVKLKATLLQLNPNIICGEQRNEVELKWIERKKRNVAGLVTTYHVLKLLAPKNIAIRCINQGRLYLEYESHRVDIWRLSPRRCTNCNGFSCTEGECKNPTVCGNCSEAHTTSACQNRSKKCALCVSASNSDHNHTVFSKDCPTWKKECDRLNDDLRSFIGMSHNG